MSAESDRYDNVIDLLAATRRRDRDAGRGRAATTSQRHPRRTEQATFRVRIELVGTPVWRLVDLRSDSSLHIVHDVIQVAMGWMNSHLHLFIQGSEKYLMQFSIDEGDLAGVPEVAVRLDEVLSAPGDVLQYDYDFGDDWEHTLTLEAVLAVTELGAVCVDGSHACPLEDCGGIPGYERLVDAAADPTTADPELVRWMDDWQPDAFDVNETNAELAAWSTLPGGLDARTDPAFGLPAPLADLVLRIRDHSVQWEMVDLARAATAESEPAIDEAVAAAMAHPFQWLLDRVGPDGLPATPNGYLKPVDVRACATELGFDDFGKNNRESQTPQVHGLRTSAQRLGLIRKLHGRFVLTISGKKLTGDPVALWRHLAAKIPVGDKAAQDAGRIVLLLTANGVPPTYEAIHAPMAALGWGYGPTAPINQSDAYSLAQPTVELLRVMGALPRFGRKRVATQPDGGMTFAMAALRSK